VPTTCPTGCRSIELVQSQHRPVRDRRLPSTSAGRWVSPGETAVPFPGLAGDPRRPFTMWAGTTCWPALPDQLLSPWAAGFVEMQLAVRCRASSAASAWAAPHLLWQWSRGGGPLLVRDRGDDAPWRGFRSASTGATKMGRQVAVERTCSPACAAGRAWPGLAPSAPSWLLSSGAM